MDREGNLGKVVVHVSGPHSPSAKARLQESCCLGQARELSMNEATNTSVNNLY